MDLPFHNRLASQEKCQPIYSSDRLVGRIERPELPRHVTSEHLSLGTLVIGDTAGLSPPVRTAPAAVVLWSFGHSALRTNGRENQAAGIVETQRDAEYEELLHTLRLLRPVVQQPNVHHPELRLSTPARAQTPG